MRWLKKILFLLLIGIIVIQFIQPGLNRGGSVQEDVAEILPVPENVHRLLRSSCYDCHSNKTRYPWYSRIQPFAWVLADHIRKGKEELNFHEFGKYSTRRRITKLNGIANSVRDGSMPIKSYKLLHPEARLSVAEKDLIVEWAVLLKDSLRSIK